MSYEKYIAEDHFNCNSARSDETDTSLANEFQTDSLVIMPVPALKRAWESERRLYVRRIFISASLLFPMLDEGPSVVDTCGNGPILEKWALVVSGPCM